MAINVRANFRKAVSKESLKDLGWAGLGGVAYTLLPTVIKQNGITGLLIAAGGTWLLGAVFGLKGMQMAAAGAMAAHLMYVHGNEYVEKALGQPIWSYGASGDGAVPAKTAMGGLASYVQNPYTGETIAAQSATDLPALPGGVNDYMDANSGASLNDSPLLPGRSWIP